MTYTAYSSAGPRIALALSEDLFHWQRLGLATFRPYEGIEFDGVDNKDASIFPVAIPDPSGKPAMAILHRPLFPGTRPEETAAARASRVMDVARESIWISYCEIDKEVSEPFHLSHFASHSRLASPVAPWEQLKIGGGAPPMLCRHGWMVIYHGVRDSAESSVKKPHLCYSAGVLILSKEHPRVIRYRSPEPILTPTSPQERLGTIGNVVFPTAVDRRDDLGSPDRFDVYYGMADDRIGVARLDVPECLSPGALVEPSASQCLRSRRRAMSTSQSSVGANRNRQRFVSTLTNAVSQDHLQLFSERFEMREHTVTLPELSLLAGTRAVVGAGLGLLLAGRMNDDQRRAVGWAFLMLGGLSTIPLAIKLLGKRDNPSR